jgi:hypothetical protein
MRKEGGMLCWPPFCAFIPDEPETGGKGGKTRSHCD